MKALSTLERENGRILLDKLDMNIINELLDNSNSSSTDIAGKLKTPLSTVQRRRTKLEKTVLKRSYDIDIKQTNWREAELFVQVDKGKTEELGKEIFEKYKNNVTLAGLTMNNVGNLIAHVYFRRSEELFAIAEEVKTNPYVKTLLYAEHLKILGQRSPRFILEDLHK
jgi:DNA-binding Lrp family transcriptional regulator